MVKTRGLQYPQTMPHAPRLPRPLLALPLLAACGEPPAAPAGLDDSVRYMFRNFHGSDAEVGAGFSGLIHWLDTEGASLLNQSANASNVNAFVIADLRAEDVARLGLPDDGRDLANANGIISVAEIDCDLYEVEHYQVHPDQKAVFDGTFVEYERTYVNSRERFEAASDAGAFTTVKQPIDIHASDFDADAMSDVLLMTDNFAQTSQIGVTISYAFHQHYRHGRFEVEVPDGVEEFEAVLAMQWLPNGSESTDSTILMQNYSVDTYFVHDGKLVRVFGLWMHVDSPLVGVDSPIWATTGVNQANGTAERLSALCSGEATL
jgi:hypothetical protein